MILLKQLTLINFLSHERTEITFTDNEKLLIDGNSGSGKSSILEAIIWVLYGQGRTSNAALIRRGAEKAEVSLTLTAPMGEVKIIRSVNKSKHTLQIVIDGVAHPYTGVRELQSWIETELTGASYMLFVNSIAYVQGSPDSFVTQNATKRKDLLLEIVKTIDFDFYYEKTKARISQEENALTGQEHEVLVHQTWLNIAAETIKIKGQVEADITKYNLEEDLATKSREQSVVALSTVDEQVKAITRVKSEIASIHGEEMRTVATIESLEKESELIKGDTTELRPRADVEANITETTQKITDVNTKISDAATVNAARVELLSSKPTDLGWSIKAEEVNKILSNPENHNKCSNGDCPYYKEQGAKLVDYAGLYAEYTQKHGRYEAELKVWNESYNMLPVIDVTPLKEILTTETGTLRSLQLELAKITTREENLRKVDTNRSKCIELSSVNILNAEKRAALEAELSALEAGIDEAAVTKHRTNIAMCDNTLATLRRERTMLQQKLGSILDTEKKMPETKQAIETAQGLITEMKANLGRLLLLKDAFGSRGLKAIVIDYILPELEDKINTILSQMSEFRVVLDTQMEKSDGEGNKEGLFITIINDMGEEMPYESYSGGEHLKITVSITEALATLQKCGFRLYDEVFLGLDQNSLESFAKVLDNLLEQFPQVVCVSHLDEIKAAFENKLFVTKHNAISHVN